jgi:DeoR/GlpR family transcriptional regulator of sugar metabolism
MDEPVAWLSTSEAAERAEVTEMHIRRLSDLGTLKAVKRDGVWFVEPESLARWIEDRNRRRALNNQQ